MRRVDQKIPDGKIGEKRNKMFTHEAQITVKGSDGKDAVAEIQKRPGSEKVGTYTKVAFHATGLKKDEKTGREEYVTDGVDPSVLFKAAIDFLAKDDPKTNPVLHLLDLATYAYD